MNESVNHPKHYQIEPFTCSEALDVIEAWKLNFNLGCAIKYILRANLKNGKEDLEKAVWYLQRELGGNKQ